MTTAYFHHASFLEHQTGAGHPESPMRARTVETVLNRSTFAGLVKKEAPRATVEQLSLLHTKQHIDLLFHMLPEPGQDIVFLDPDTTVSQQSGVAALHAVGAVIAAIDAVFAGEVRNAFCGVRPPGHHALPDAAMGFCLFNNIAVGAAHARKTHGIRRVAIVDFDVHHGNGTQAAFEANAEVLYASTHQHPWFPGTGPKAETGVGNIFNVPLKAGSGSAEFREAMSSVILPAVDRFRPELVLVSAGFDAHRGDPLGKLNLEEDDFAWITGELLRLADRHAKGRLVSSLEGGYNLEALGESVAAHVQTLLTHKA